MLSRRAFLGGVAKTAVVVPVVAAVGLPNIEPVIKPNHWIPYKDFKRHMGLRVGDVIHISPDIWLENKINQKFLVVATETAKP